MPIVHQKNLRLIWLTLLTAIVLCASVTSQANWAECQQTKIELKSEANANTSSDDDNTSGCALGLIATGLQSFSSPNINESPLAVTHSDAYASLILHGPPAIHHQV